MTSAYTERVEVRRGIDPGDCGDPDPETGLIPDCPPGSDYQVVLEGLADVQDKPTILMRDAAGLPTLTADAVCFLADEKPISLVKPGDTVIVTWQDESTSDAEVMKVERFEGTMYLRRL